MVESAHHDPPKLPQAFRNASYTDRKRDRPVADSAYSSQFNFIAHRFFQTVLRAPDQALRGGRLRSISIQGLTAPVCVSFHNRRGWVSGVAVGTYPSGLGGACEPFNAINDWTLFPKGLAATLLGRRQNDRRQLYGLPASFSSDSLPKS